MKELQNQPQISMKRVEEEDRISELPDSLLVEILSRVGLVCTKYVVITSALSKRWQYLWTFLPYLIFHEGPSDFYSYVGKTLTQCSRELKLNKFGVHMDNPIRCELLVNEWIEYAIGRNVEHLSISCKSEFLPNKSFYIHSCFTSIVLKDCILNYTGPIGWKNLKRLYFEETKVDKDLIENILSGSPLLETFHLNHCYGYKRLNITSKSVKHLLVSGFWYRPYEESYCDSVEINAPYILSLTIGESWTSRKVLLLDVSSLVNAYFHFSVVTEEVINKLRHAKEIKIWDTCLGVPDYLEEKKGFVHPQVGTAMD